MAKERKFRNEDTEKWKKIRNIEVRFHDRTVGRLSFSPDNRESVRMMTRSFCSSIVATVVVHVLRWYTRIHRVIGL